MEKAIGKLSPRKVTVFITGPNGTGKTTVLQKLNFGNISDTLTDDYKFALVGDVESRSGERVEVVAWNIYGSRCPSVLLSDYRHIDAIIYVVNDRGPPDNHMEIAKLGIPYFEHQRFKNTITAVAVNQRNAEEGTPMTLEEVRSVLELDKRSTYVEVFPIEATTGEGLEKIQDWLTCELGKKFTRQYLFGPDDQQTKKRDAAPFHSRILNSFKGLFSRI